jgi:hypothetical protein
MRRDQMYEYHILGLGQEAFDREGERTIRTQAQKGWRLVSVIPPPSEHPRMAISLFGLPLISVLPQPRFRTSFGLRNQYRLIFERPDEGSREQA